MLGTEDPRGHLDDPVPPMRCCHHRRLGAAARCLHEVHGRMTRPHVEQIDRDAVDDHNTPEAQPAYDTEEN